MSDTAELKSINDRDHKGRFVSGNVGGPGRKLGSRNQLASSFISDLRDAWEIHGVAALEKCATQEPAMFCRIIAGLMPRDVNLSVSVDATEFVGRFRQAVALLGNEAPVKVINGR